MFDCLSGTFWALITAVVCLLIVPTLIMNVDPGDLERACKSSGGVQQVHSVTYPPSVTLAVCKDGSVKEVK